VIFERHRQGWEHLAERIDEGPIRALRSYVSPA